MIPLLLSLTLAAAPIPKVGTYEGSIALFLIKPEPTAVILTPSGEEVKRISLKEIDGSIETVRIGRDRACLLVETREENPNFKGQFQQSIYWINLNEKSKPKRIITRDNHFTWMVNRESTTVYGSESNLKANANSKVLEPQTHWQYDLKTGKTEKIDLPEQYQFVDIAHESDSILAALSPAKGAANDFRFAILSTKTWQATYQSPIGTMARLISPDGKSIVGNEFKTLPNGNKQLKGMSILNVKSSERVDYPQINSRDTVLSFTIGTNNRVACVIQEFDPLNPNSEHQEVHVLSYDGTKSKKIYVPKPNEMIQDCDWR